MSFSASTSSSDVEELALDIAGEPGILLLPVRPFFSCCANTAVDGVVADVVVTAAVGLKGIVEARTREGRYAESFLAAEKDEFDAADRRDCA